MTDPIDPTLEAGYVSAQGRPHWPATIADFIARSEAVAARAEFEADLVYGPHPRQRWDFLPAGGAPRAILAYFHPGYWQMRDKAVFRCLMPLFADLGCDAVVANYPLCPDATLAELTAAAQALVPALAADARRRHGRDLPVVIAGHSAGGHLAVELALAQSAPAGPIAAAVALSGVYDLAPLIPTSLNRALRLDAASAAAASPVTRVGTIGCPALFAVGGGETPAFLAQNRAMAEAWTAAGHDARVIESGSDDHFSLITTLEDRASPLHRAVAAFLDETLTA